MFSKYLAGVAALGLGVAIGSTAVAGEVDTVPDHRQPTGEKQQLFQYPDKPAPSAVPYQKQGDPGTLQEKARANGENGERTDVSDRLFDYPHSPAPGDVPYEQQGDPGLAQKKVEEMAEGPVTGYLPDEDIESGVVD